MSSSITCIGCPLGCRITVEKIGEEIKVSGYGCKKGKKYAVQEIKGPQRVVTTTIFIDHGTQQMLPVRSEKEIPKHLVKTCVGELSKMKVVAPVKCGEIVYKNILGTGVNIVASRDMGKEG